MVVMSSWLYRRVFLPNNCFSKGNIYFIVLAIESQLKTLKKVFQMGRWLVDGSDDRSAASGSVGNKSLIYSPLTPAPMFVIKKYEYIYTC